MEARRVRPPSDAQHDLQVAVLLLEEVELLEAAVEVASGLVPGVALVVDVLVGPEVGEGDLAGAGVDVGEGIEDVAGVI